MHTLQTCPMTLVSTARQDGRDVYFQVWLRHTPGLQVGSRVRLEGVPGDWRIDTIHTSEGRAAQPADRWAVGQRPHLGANLTPEGTHVCQNPTCGRRFTPHRPDTKGIYCSRPCANRDQARIRKANIGRALQRDRRMQTRADQQEAERRVRQADQAYRGGLDSSLRLTSTL